MIMLYSISRRFCWFFGRFNPQPNGFSASLGDSERHKACPNCVFGDYSVDGDKQPYQWAKWRGLACLSDIHIQILAAAYCLALLSLVPFIDDKGAGICFFFIAYRPIFVVLTRSFNGSVFSKRFQGFSSNPNIIGLYAAVGVLM